LIVTASVVPSSPILVSLKEAVRYSETSVLTRAMRHNITEGVILHIFVLQKTKLMYDLEVWEQIKINKLSKKKQTEILI
jgi:hypothetical protein